MQYKKFFEDEESYVDLHGNRVSKRILPSGAEFAVVKNFPSEEELADVFAAYTGRLTYHEFGALERWMLIFERA